MTGSGAGPWAGGAWDLGVVCCCEGGLGGRYGCCGGLAVELVLVPEAGGGRDP